jgi:hypothetical protein
MASRDAILRPPIPAPIMHTLDLFDDDTQLRVHLYK